MTRRAQLRSWYVAACIAALTIFAPVPSAAQQRGFPHDRHARVFPLCTTCHAGVTETGESIWPDPARCASCHDGTVEPRVTWAPRVGPRAGNRRFTHDAHARAATERNPADSAQIGSCAACHNTRGDPRMAVRPAVVGNCLECHGVRERHFDAPAQACATCHVRLTDAPGLTRDVIARFEKPASHIAPDFLLGGHGRAARGTPGESGRRAIAASCATCHARDLCVTCHVNAPDSPIIQALEPDARVPVYGGALPKPASHALVAFVRSHGADAARAGATCSTCHTRQTCTTCHTGIVPRAVAALPSPGPGRASGVHLVRTPPAGHTTMFRERHGAEASVRSATCETCHARSSCLECHRPDGGRTASFHARGWLTRHPSAAYSRAANCADCHNTAQFCQSCHQQSGLIARARLGRAGYHDAYRGFSLGHGQAARQNLESCVACHTERDCAACHATPLAGGFGFNPHGPGFDAARARARNPSSCIACHGSAIPRGR